jgi:hypothetical protein
MVGHGPSGEDHGSTEVGLPGKAMCQSPIVSIATIPEAPNRSPGNQSGQKRRRPGAALVRD